MHSIRSRATPSERDNFRRGFFIQILQMADFGDYLYRVIVTPSKLLTNLYREGAYETENFKYEKAPFDLLVLERGVKLKINGFYFELPKDKIDVEKASYDIDTQILTVDIQLTIPYTTYKIYCKYSGQATFIPYKTETVFTL